MMTGGGGTSTTLVAVVAMVATVLVRLIPGAVAQANCCQTLTAFNGQPGWHNFSQYVSGKYGRPLTSYTMEYGNKSVCASSKRADLVNNAFNGCSGRVTYPEAKRFCEGAGGRLCTLAELQADETHGSGCNYDFEHIWSSTSCPSCSENSASFYTQWGYSAVAENRGVRTPAECVESTSLAFARCCADTCPGTDPEGDYQALLNIVQGTTKTGSGGCPNITDELGSWPDTLPGGVATKSCPGRPDVSMSRSCSAGGVWQSTNDIATTQCPAPNACDVCSCYDCGGSTGQPCGAAVGLQTSSRGVEHFVDCAHKFLVVVPVNFPFNTSRIDLQGNSMIRRFQADSFANCVNVWRIYLQGMLNLDSLPSNVFAPMQNLEIFDTSDFPQLQQLPILNLPRLSTFILHFWGIATLDYSTPFLQCPRLTLLEISNVQFFLPGAELLRGASALQTVKFVGNTRLAAIPPGFFSPARNSLTSVQIRYCHDLSSLPANMLSRSTSALLSVDIEENAALTSIGPRVFSGMNGVGHFLLESSTNLNIASSAFANAGAIATLIIEGIDLATTSRGAFVGLDGVSNIQLIGRRNDSYSSAQPMRDDEPFQYFTQAETMLLEHVMVTGLSPKLFHNMIRLRQLGLRCVPLGALHSNIFAKTNTALRSFSATEMPNMTSIAPNMFADVSALESIDLSNNPSLVSLDANVFDGTFATSAVSRPRILLSSSNLQSITKRAFNFDATGLASKAVVTIGTGAGNPGLTTCCGYDWLLIDRHFATSDLQCVNAFAQRVQIGSSLATTHCCIEASNVAGMQTLREVSQNPDFTSFFSLNNTVRNLVALLCDEALWNDNNGDPQRLCGANCITDTSPQPLVLQRVLQPDASDCSSSRITCPSGYRSELAGPLNVLECEPWQHRSLPEYEIRHFVGELVCEKCGVLNCSRCDASARSCEACVSGFKLLTDDRGQICVDNCPGGYFEAANSATGLTVCEASQSESVQDAGGTVAAVLIPILLVFAIAFWVYHRHTQRQLAELIAKLGDHVVVTDNFALDYIPAEDDDEIPREEAAAAAAPAPGNGAVAAGQAAPAPKWWWFWEEDVGRLSLHDPDIVSTDGGSFVAYEPSVSDEVEGAFLAVSAGNGPSSICITLGGGKKAGKNTGTQFAINFETMQQVNQKSGHARSIFRMEPPKKYQQDDDDDDYLNVDGADGGTENRRQRSVAGIEVNGVKRTHSLGRAENLAKYGLPPTLIEQGDEILPLETGLLVKVTKRGERDTAGWAYGTTVFDPANDAISGGRLEMSGWFEESCTAEAPRRLVEDYNRSLGSDESELAPPETWTGVDSMTDVVKLVPVPLNSEEVRDLIAEWQGSMGGQRRPGCYPVRGKICKIERIQNLSLWQSYAVKRIQIRNRDNEPGAKPHPDFSLVRHNAWHGTTEEIVGKIMQQGFNRSFCGRNMCRYGKGVYFARDAAYSAQPAYAQPGKDGYCRMLSCRVLHGIYCKGEENALTPDVYDASTNRLYDSTVNDVRNPIMWITYHDAQAYPEYLIYFKVQN
mmetsp:Transcript_7547/g.19452  ORF Transcript_7547/g.19452 Transcript_7547/m.19452 type:complete len:1532 (-) Transcript_7547:376-4971(-)